MVRFLFHTFEEFLGSGVPVELVGVGYKQCERLLGAVAEDLHQLVVVEGGEHLCRVELEFLRQPSRKRLLGAEFANGYKLRILTAGAEFVHQSVDTHLRLNNIASRTHVLRIFLVAGKHREKSGVGKTSAFAKTVHDVVIVRTRVYVKHILLRQGNFFVVQRPHRRQSAHKRYHTYSGGYVDVCFFAALAFLAFSPFWHL